MLTHPHEWIYSYMYTYTYMYLCVKYGNVYKPKANKCKNCEKKSKKREAQKCSGWMGVHRVGAMEIRIIYECIKLTHFVTVKTDLNALVYMNTDTHGYLNLTATQ